MPQKIEKNYLGSALAHFDIDGNQIIEMREWCAYFGTNKNSARLKAKELLKNILKDYFPKEVERLPILSEAIIINHSDLNKDGEKQLNLTKLYDYVIRFIAPQKYREYQEKLKDKRNFFLYDGVIELSEFNIFMDRKKRMICADVYYFLVSYHIAPQIAEKLLEVIKKEPEIKYQSDDYSLDALAVFECLSHEKDGEKIIDIDSLLQYAQHNNIDAKVSHIFHLFGLHNDLFQKIKENKNVEAGDFIQFINFNHIHYFELGLKMVLDALDIQVKDMAYLTGLLNDIGYHGNPRLLFREISQGLEHFNTQNMRSFLEDNGVKIA